MTFTHRPVDPAADVDLLHDWVTQPRAEFWGMTTYTRAEVGEVYAYLDASTTHHAWLVHRDGVPVAIFQTYEPAADPVGKTYDVQDGDLGVHLFVGPTRAPESGFTGRVVEHVLASMLIDPAVRRVVVEPDVDNVRSIALFHRTGMTDAAVVTLPGKIAQLAFATREELERRMPALRG
jgi:RimJ/RimL family protein N-acetyltransferase